MIYVEGKCTDSIQMAFRENIWAKVNGQIICPDFYSKI